MHAQPSSEVRSLNFGLGLYSLPYFVFESSKVPKSRTGSYLLQAAVSCTGLDNQNISA